MPNISGGPSARGIPTPVHIYFMETLSVLFLVDWLGSDPLPDGAPTRFRMGLRPASGWGSDPLPDGAPTRFRMGSDPLPDGLRPASGYSVGTVPKLFS
jgi:hypothetical protein